jgi:hypothetical protein
VGYETVGQVDNVETLERKAVMGTATKPPESFQCVVIQISATTQETEKNVKFHKKIPILWLYFQS